MRKLNFCPSFSDSAIISQYQRLVKGMMFEQDEKMVDAIEDYFLHNPGSSRREIAEKHGVGYKTFCRRIQAVKAYHPEALKDSHSLPKQIVHVNMKNGGTIEAVHSRIYKNLPVHCNANMKQHSVDGEDISKIDLCQYMLKQLQSK